MQSAAALAGYTDADNPFNDQQLTKPFLWHKKQQQSQQQPQLDMSADALQARQAALVAEVESVKQRRKERDEERRAMDEMKEQMDRERAAEQVAGWEEKEEDFHRQQARRRTKIRVQERRERAVDLLMKNVAFEQWLAEDEEEDRIRRQRERMLAAGAAATTAAASSAPSTAAHSAHSALSGSTSSMRPSLLREAQLTNPVSLLSALQLSDLLELRADLTHLLQLNEQMEYWTAIATLCDDEIVRAKGERSTEGVASEVLRDISAMMRDKSVSELQRLSQQVQQALEDGVDVPYWRAVSKQLEVYTAKAQLRAAHADMLRRRLELLQDERRRRDTQQPHNEEGAVGSGATGSSRPLLQVDTDRAGLSVESDVGALVGEESNADHHLSPRLFSFDEQLDVPVIEASDDLRAMAQQRAAVLARYQPHLTLQQLHHRHHYKEAASSMPQSSDQADSEYTIANEVSLPASSTSVSTATASSPSTSFAPSSQLSWSSKWRPRKPRYFNRVKTGFDWNKYNQVHYDKDNPPPKLVQGYKFNLFYPDLIDPTVTPTYRLQPLDGDEQGNYCILRFSAGPPYEDVAFKIVRKEWEFGPRRGFRCSFDKGVLQLHFNFKRYFYRR